MELKIKYLILTSFLLAVLLYALIKISLENFSIIDFEKIETLLFISLMIGISYFGTIVFSKLLIEGISFWTQNMKIIRSITILVTFIIIMYLFTSLDIFMLDINNNDKGIIFEIMGFFIYLNPIKKYISNLFKSKKDSFIEHDLIVNTTSVILVSVGLILQLSSFT